jgi:ABC-type transporter Mla MlaB component
MLKISESKSNQQTITFQLEGQIIGPWVEELRQLCEPLLADETKLTLDLGEVSFADEPGVTLLTSLGRRGAKLSKPSPFLAEQLKTHPSGTLK